MVYRLLFMLHVANSENHLSSDTAIYLPLKYFINNLILSELYILLNWSSIQSDVEYLIISILYTPLYLNNAYKI